MAAQMTQEVEGRVRIPATQLAERRHESTHILLWLVAGEGWVRLGQRVITIGAGEALWIPAGTVHEPALAADSAALPMFFDAGEYPDGIRGLRVVPVEGDLELACLALVQCSYSALAPAVDLQRIVLDGIARLAALPEDQLLPQSPAARAAASLMLHAPTDNRRIEELAQAVHVSPRSLERAFRTETGLSPRQWRTRLRMHLARTLLDQGASVAATASRVGYTSLNAFVRAYRSRWGTTPQGSRVGELTKMNGVRWNQ